VKFGQNAVGGRHAAEQEGAGIGSLLVPEPVGRMAAYMTGQTR